MKLPSLQIVIAAAGETLRRFPLVLAASALAAVAGIVIVDHPDDGSPWLRILLAATLGLPFFTATTITLERKALGGVARVGVSAAAAALLVAFFFASEHWLEPVLVARYVQFSLALHLLASFLPYVGRGPAPGFWPYNMTLFLRFLVSGLFAGVLFFGLAIALLAVDKLFGVKVDGENYGRLCVVIAFVFHAWYFLGGIPRDLSSLDRSTEYPNGLRVFAQYILVPLVTVYLAILTAYFVRVIITREWPSGWIGWLVSSVSVAGLLAQLLVHPVKDRPENRWVATCTRAFHLGLLPAVFMLFAAIWQRVQQYGVTENRYFLAVWAIWILGIVLYFLFSRRKSIRVIPASLALLALATSFGPWGAYAAAERSQVGRLAGLLETNGLLAADGTAHAAATAVPFGARKEISSITRYLLEHHGVEALARWFEDGLPEVEATALDTPSTRVRGSDGARAVLARLGLEYVERWETEKQRPFTYSGSAHGVPVDIHDYDTAVRFAKLDVPEARGYSLVWDDAGPSFIVRKDDEIRIVFPAEDVLESARAAARSPGDGAAVSPEAFHLRAQNDSVRALLAMEQIHGKDQPEGVSVHFAAGTVYLSFTRNR